MPCNPKEGCGKASQEGTLIKSTMGKATEINKDDAKAIQDEKDVLMDVPKAVTEKELKEEVLDIKKKCGVMEKVGATSEESTFIESIVKKTLKSQRMMPKPSNMRLMF